MSIRVVAQITIGHFICCQVLTQFKMQHPFATALMAAAVNGNYTWAKSFSAVHYKLQCHASLLHVRRHLCNPSVSVLTESQTRSRCLVKNWEYSHTPETSRRQHTWL
eukprot:2698262-Pleurochrysis_carterae.AAC.4